MLLLSINEIYYVVVVYIMLHGIIKRQIFQSSGYGIHGVGTQDIRSYVMNVTTYIMFVGIMLLSAIIGMVIVMAKEVVVLGLSGIFMLIVVLISYVYTLFYVNKCDGVSFVGEIEG